jgi:tetratricopeptide (TPR) repeat protein
MTEGEALAALLASDDPGLVAQAEATLWRIWCAAGDPDLDALMTEGTRALEGNQLAEAETIFTRLIQRAASFAEGWNKRATTRYLAQDYAGAIADCIETLARNPNHFGALSGQGLCHLARGEHREAAAMFRRALAVHPRLTAARHNLAAALSSVVQGNGRP